MVCWSSTEHNCQVVPISHHSYTKHILYILQNTPAFLRRHHVECTQHTHAHVSCFGLLISDEVCNDLVGKDSAAHGQLGHGGQSLSIRGGRQPLLYGILLISMTITCYYRLPHDVMSNGACEVPQLILSQAFDEAPGGSCLRPTGPLLSLHA